MDTSLVLTILNAIFTALIAYFSFSADAKKTRSKVFIGLLIGLLLASTCYKSYLDKHLQKNLEKQGATINWTSGQIVNVSNKSELANIAFNNSTVNDYSGNKPDSVNSVNQPVHTSIDTSQLTEIPDKDLPPSDCILSGFEAPYFHGRFYLISQLPEKILLYKIAGNQQSVDCNVLISPNQAILTPLVRVTGIDNNKPDSIVGSDQCNYYFRTVDSKEVKYGSILLTVRACKIRTQILNSSNLYLGSEVNHP